MTSRREGERTHNRVATSRVGQWLAGMVERVSGGRVICVAGERDSLRLISAWEDGYRLGARAGRQAERWRIADALEEIVGRKDGEQVT